MAITGTPHGKIQCARSLLSFPGDICLWCKPWPAPGSAIPGDWPTQKEIVSFIGFFLNAGFDLHHPSPPPKETILKMACLSELADGSCFRSYCSFTFLLLACKIVCNFSFQYHILNNWLVQMEKEEEQFNCSLVPLYAIYFAVVINLLQ